LCAQAVQPSQQCAARKAVCLTQASITAHTHT
jgi:hypothetical protein